VSRYACNEFFFFFFEPSVCGLLFGGVKIGLDFDRPCPLHAAAVFSNFETAVVYIFLPLLQRLLLLNI
jgi:hypothetical protein